MPNHVSASHPTGQRSNPLIDTLFNDFFADDLCVLCAPAWIFSTPHTHRPRRRLQHHRRNQRR